MKCHCGKTLKKKEHPKGGFIYECSICKCVYRFCLVHKSNECARKEYKEGLRSLKEIKKAKKRGRGRPKKTT